MADLGFLRQEEPTPGGENLFLANFFSKNCMKMKKNCSEGGSSVSSAHPKFANGNDLVKNYRVSVST